ncbi:MAG TPA: SDR family oxidoreductase [Vicinamibacterales bacterium]|jgi:UDP-glucose 4-epimerase|nr:SDR family oxidoreductase [Acidobacteriota bacterium]HQX81498.1 SDR family oxidoreductase [Vicinamibacterales bacterium]
MSLYLVTGGAGFIGSHLVEALLKRGDQVRVVDNFSTGKRENVPAGVDVIEGDLADDGVAVRAVVGCDYVLHQAAIPSVPRSVKDPLGTHRANVDGTMQLLVASRDAGVKRLVFAGSSSTYGNSAVLPKREDMRPSPITPYALQKYIGEQYCQLFTSLYGLETVTTRYFNVFGPRQAPDSPYSGVISLFIKALLAGQSPLIHGDGRQTRDFTYVANVVDGVLRAATAEGVSGEVINVATGGRISLLELVRAVQLILGSDKAPTFDPPREGDVKDSQADIFKARKMLGYDPSVPFEDGLRQTVAWFKTLSV